MVRIGDVWDRTTEVMQGRPGMLASIAGLTLFLPDLVSRAITVFAPLGESRPVLTMILGAIVFVLAILGTLALTAAAMDPRTDRAAALRIAIVRIGPGIGIVAMLLLVFGALAIPGVALIIRAGYDFDAAAKGLPQTNIDPGQAGPAIFYFAVYAVIVLVLLARLAVLNPVIVGERRVFGSIVRAFAMTRGLTLKIIGVVILYAIVFGVAVAAASSVSGLVFRLALGTELLDLVTFLAGTIGGLVTTLFEVLSAVFCAQLYVAIPDHRESTAKLQ